MDPQVMLAAMMAASKSSQRIAAKGGKGGKGGRGDTGRGRGRGGVTKPAHNLQQQWHGDEYLQQQQQGKGGGKGGGKGARGKGGGGAKNFWEARPDLARLRTLQLDDAAKAQLDALFGMMDANGDGFLRLDDFEIIASRSSTLPQAAKSKALMYFTKLQEELDFNSDGKIEPEEFIRGMIKIAFSKPVSSALRTPPDGSHPIDYAISRLEVAANNAVKELCKGLAAWMQSIGDEM
jgi:hypothetical protein